MDRPRFESGERVDLLDFARTILHGHLEGDRNMRCLLRRRDGVTPSGLVFSGFGIAPNLPAHTAVVVSLANDSRMLLHERQDTNNYYGRICEDEQGAGQIPELGVADFTPPAGAAAGVLYDLYVRMTYDPVAQEQRIFWNPTIADEEAQLMYTASRPVYQLNAVHSGAAAPWPEGVKIAEINVGDTIVGQIHVADITETRTYFFEGEDATDFLPTTLWGAGADRNDTRDADGVNDLYTHVQMVRRQLADIMGQGDPAALALTTHKPWGAIDTFLPSLYTLGLEHFPAGHADVGHHRSLEIHDALGAALITFVDTGGGPAASEVIAHRGDDLVFGRAVGTSAMVRVISRAPGVPGGLVIGGPNGIGGAPGDMGGGEAAHLRFGDIEPAGAWNTGRDFALVARGAAADADRQLGFEVGGGGADSARVYGNGRLRILAAADYGYLTAKQIHRRLSGSDFLPISDGLGGAGGALVQLAVDMPALVGVYGNNLWIAVQQDVAGARLAGGGWAAQQLVTGDATDRIAANRLASGRLTASLALIPNGMTIDTVTPGQVEVTCESDAQFAANHQLEIQLIAQLTATGPPLQVAYARVSPAVVKANRLGNWIQGPDWAAHNGGSGVINHFGWCYSLVIGAYDAGGAGTVCAGAEVAVYSVGLPFNVSGQFSH